ncbi:MAG: polyamine aminopropyltransferase [Clostridia bacterium]|nr:polyamine aminopropyltransferase [Clostridia bacterium]
MDLWFCENHCDGVKFQIKIDQHLYSGESDFQKIDIFQTEEFGKILILDGLLMLTEKDEFIYHEMITHIPMAVNPFVKKILVIGAGDGGTVKRLVQYDTIEEIDVVEIDKLVVEKCIEYFPDLTSGFDDKRVSIKFEDGLKFVRKKSNYYDLIIVDSTDPFGPGEGLFTKEFYGNCYKALNENGILVNQHESPFYNEYKDIVKKTHQKLALTFPISELYQAHIPTYPSGHWLFGFASKKFNGTDINEAEWLKHDIKCKYYNIDLHKGAFALPTYVKEMIK